MPEEIEKKKFRFWAYLSGHRRFPLMLALAAMVLMLPALPAGLFGDDVIQRLAQLKLEQLPPHIVDTGFVSNHSGTLGSVVRDLFGYLRTDEAGQRARDYGILPWWAADGWKAALWRPLTAFTHWVDYQLFPHSPALMHAHNILWFAVLIFLAAKVYRQIGTYSSESDPKKIWSVAALASVLFLLDKDTYLPVLYVANRGFFVALFFGLLCLQGHERWRTGQERKWMWLSVLWLLLSLLANESGASTLAFLLAYALVLERGGWRERMRSLWPAGLVVLGWRVVYVSGGFGVREVGYIDPGYNPWVFLNQLASRLNGLLGGQLTGLPPEVSLVLSPGWQVVMALVFAGFSVVCAVVFWPVVQRDRVARFWGTVMVLALVPAATVTPLSKNLGFVAMGAFGLVAAFLVGFANGKERAGLGTGLRAASWLVAIWLVLAHVTGALACRVAMGWASPSFPKITAKITAYICSGFPEIGERDVVFVTDSSPIPLMLAFDRAYRGQPLPKGIRVLAPGYNRVEVSRPDASTLVLKVMGGPDLFSCPTFGAVHPGYFFKAANDFLFHSRKWPVGAKILRKGFEVEVREVTAEGQPRTVAFRFANPLESEGRVWMYFDWHKMMELPFVLPKIGGSVEIAGPGFMRIRP